MKVKLPGAISARPVIRWQDCVAKTFTVNGVRKPGMSVYCHSMAVAYVCRELYLRLPRSSRILILADYVFWAAVHDVGKISPGFQYGRILGLVVPELIDHSEISEACLVAIFPVLVPFEIPRMVGGHHGRWHVDSPLPVDRATYGGPEWQDERQKFVDVMISKFGMPSQKPGFVNSLHLNMTLALISVADWIASDEQNFDPSREYTEEEIKTMASGIVAKMGWDGFTAKKGLKFIEVFPKISVPNKIQLAIDKIVKGPGVYIVEAATGDGKTETALWAAYQMMAKKKMHGMYFAMPTRLTSNCIHQRVVTWAGNICKRGRYPRLIHGQVDYKNLPASGQLAPSGRWFSSNRRAILESIGVGTVDQALLAVMNVKYHYIRLAGLMGKVVILDEVHSYDAYTGSLLVGLVKELRAAKCVVIILSATLTREAKAKLLDVGIEKVPRGGYPMITSRIGRKISTMSFRKTPSKIFDLKYVHSEPFSDVVKMAQNGANVVWFENSVNEGVGVYRKLKHSLPNIPVGLLHSRFVMPRRSEIEKHWMNMLGPNAVNRPKGCVLVVTQIGEQSLDIDFDVLVSRLAPSDFLIQRMGRIWRHSGRQRPAWLSRPLAYIIGPDLSKMEDKDTILDRLGVSSLIYSPFTLVRSAEVWSGMSSVSLPTQTRTLLEKTYRKAKRSDPAWMRMAYINLLANNGTKEFQAFNAMSWHLLSTEEEDDRDIDDVESLPTRRESVPTQQVVLCQRVDFIDADTMRLVLYDGQTVDIPRKEVPIEARSRYMDVSKRLNWNMIKVPRIKFFDDVDRTWEPLRNVIYGNAVAMVVGRTGEMTQESGSYCGYYYSDEVGAHRVDL